VIGRNIAQSMFGLLVLIWGKSWPMMLTHVTRLCRIYGLLHWFLWISPQVKSPQMMPRCKWSSKKKLDLHPSVEFLHIGTLLCDSCNVLLKFIDLPWHSQVLFTNFHQRCMWDIMHTTCKHAQYTQKFGRWNVMMMVVGLSLRSYSYNL